MASEQVERWREILKSDWDENNPPVVVRDALSEIFARYHELGLCEDQGCEPPNYYGIDITEGQIVTEGLWSMLDLEEIEAEEERREGESTQVSEPVESS